jgi:hypothetical protein
MSLPAPLKFGDHLEPPGSQKADAISNRSQAGSGMRIKVAIAVAALALNASAWAARTAPTTSDAVATGSAWNGVWVLADSFMDKQDGTFLATPGRVGEDKDPPVSEPKLKGEYLIQHEALLKAEAAGTRTGDSGAECLPQGMPRFWHGPYAFEIMRSPQQINIYQEWNEQTRRIYLDGRKDNPDADPSFNGHSIGHWEGRELVIDTDQVRKDSGLGAGATHSDQMHISERIKQIGPDLLQVTMTVTDPMALAEPWVSRYRLRRKLGMEIEEYVCAENNRNTTDANGVTQSGTASK